MKKFTFILFVLTVFTIKINAQIPNSGFESWTTVGSYEDPTGVWKTSNSYCSGPFYPVTKSTDHYPADVGNYSIKMENDTSLLPSMGACGIALTNPTSVAYGPDPSFTITGHPTKLCGWYKFLPQNNDTMVIKLDIYQGTQKVAQALLITWIAKPEWTSFIIPISSYTSADAASLMFSTYMAECPPPTCAPHGSSILYIDNLSFDTLIVSVNEEVSNHLSYKIYPNPASDIVTINMNNPNNDDAEIIISNLLGDVVFSEKMNREQQEINTVNFNDGIYLVSIKTGKTVKTGKLIIQK